MSQKKNMFTGSVFSGRQNLAILCTSYLLGKDKPTPIKEIADHLDCSVSYIEQLFLQLRKSGILSSVKGPGGGYLLEEPNKLTVRDLILSVDKNAFKAYFDISVYRKIEETLGYMPLTELRPNNKASA